MKILLLQDYLRSGGTERQSVLLANAFAAAGHETTLVTFRPGGTLDATVDPRVRRHALQRFDLRWDWFAPGLWRTCARSAPDIILCMGRMANVWAGSLQRRLPRTAVIATMRTGRNLPLLFRRSLRLCRHIVANSQEARENLVAGHGLPARKISVIPNALVFPPAATAGPEDAAARRALRDHYGAGPDTTVLLCVAMFRPEKNQRELIAIAEGLPAGFDWQLWLAGDGPARAACEQLAAERSLGSRIRFPGFQSDPSPLYRAADLAVHASWSEALSNFLIEAQAHGLPAVAYEAQGVRECFLPEHTGWCISRDDRTAFRDALTRWRAQTPSARADCAAAAAARARDAFAPDRQIAAYLELFANLAASRDPQRQP